jgi:hypothetical protein
MGQPVLMVLAQVTAVHVAVCKRADASLLWDWDASDVSCTIYIRVFPFQQDCPATLHEFIASTETSRWAAHSSCYVQSVGSAPTQHVELSKDAASCAAGPTAPAADLVCCAGLAVCTGLSGSIAVCCSGDMLAADLTIWLCFQSSLLTLCIVT